MLAYITIGTNDFQRSVDFYEAFFKVPSSLVLNICSTLVLKRTLKEVLWGLQPFCNKLQVHQ